MPKTVTSEKFETILATRQIQVLFNKGSNSSSINSNVHSSSKSNKLR